jgi:hypothetical protein
VDFRVQLTSFSFVVCSIIDMMLLPQGLRPNVSFYFLINLGLNFIFQSSHASRWLEVEVMLNVIILWLKRPFF